MAIQIEMHENVMAIGVYRFSKFKICLIKFRGSS